MKKTSFFSLREQKSCNLPTKEKKLFLNEKYSVFLLDENPASFICKNQKENYDFSYWEKTCPFRSENRRVPCQNLARLRIVKFGFGEPWYHLKLQSWWDAPVHFGKEIIYASQNMTLALGNACPPYFDLFTSQRIKDKEESHDTP